MEEWKDIPEWEGRYQISNLGRVRSIKYNCIMKPQSNNGYLQVHLKKGSVYRKKFFLHRLVALVFIPNPDDLPEVNHKHRNKFDNRAIELEWSNHKDNANHWRNTPASESKEPEMAF